MKTLKKSLLLLFATLTLVVLFCFSASALSYSSGSCGDNVTYTYNSTTKELVISGTGAMKNYSDYPSPFYDSDLESVVIKSGVTTIGDYAFYNCVSLQSVTIPDSVTTIGKGAFYLCDSLQSITVDKDNKYYCNDDYGVLFNKNKTELIQYPIGNSRTSYTIPDSVTTIGSGAFESCDSLQSVTIGNSVTTIGEYAFRGCDSLQSVTIPDSVTTIGSHAFSYCDSLRSVTIPDSVTNIGSSAFYDTAYYNNENNWKNGVLYINNHLIEAKENVESVTIKQGTKTIGSSAFYNCDSLQSVTIPDSVTTIGEYAFSDCSKLKMVHYSGTVSEWKNILIADNSGITTITRHYCITKKQIDETCTKDGRKAGLYCEICGEYVSGGEIIISKSHLVDTKYTVDKNPTCTTKGSKSYHCLREGCDYKTGAINISPTGHLNKSTHPFQESTCKEIGYTEGEFCNDCKTWISGHETIDLSHTDTDGNNICDDCSEDMSKIVLFGACSEQGDMITYTLYTNGNLVISGSGEMTDYESEDLPWYEKKGSIKVVTIKENVKRIDEDSFRECYNLSEITVDKNNKYYSNDSFGVLFNKGKTELIQYPLGKNIKVYYVPDTVTTIGVAAFEGCKNIQGVMIPESVTTISSKAFCECRQLEDVIIPEGVSVIGYYAFALCDSFKNITVPESVKVMGDCAFSGCNSLETVTIHEGLTSIDSYTFEHCFSLKSVSLPTTVEKIGYKAFNGCFNLKKIYYAGTEDDFFWDVIIDGENKYLEDAAISYSHKHGYSLSGTQKATCILYGLKKYSCICGGIYATEIPATGHTEIVDEAVAPACATTGLTEGKHCSVCGEVFVAQQKIDATGHKYSTATTKATLTKNGRVETKCTVCGYVKNSTTIYSPKTFTLSTTKYTYDGKNKTPSLTIKDSKGKKLVKGTDYKLTVASKRSAVGRHTVKVTFMGNYSGTKNVYFYILPGKSASVKSSAQTSSAIKLTWSKVAGASGYTVYRYSPSKKAYVKAGVTTGTSYTVKNLLAGTKYTFKVVAYGKTSSGKVYNSNTYALIKTATCTKTPTVKLASTAKGRATVAWTNVSGETGYQVYYATSKNGTYSRIANYKANTAKAYKTGLKSGRTYYFKVRTYINTDSGYVYSPFSAVKSVKIK